MLCLGAFLLLLGIALGGLSLITCELAEWVVGCCALLGCGVWLRHTGGRWKQARLVRQAPQSELALELTQQLFGNHSPYVIEAAQRLGAARDTTAVPALIYVLERCVDSQQPGWRDVAESIAIALGEIGDGRALPLLYRLENVRGIGFIPAIRSAIAEIEPQSSLLRAGSADEMQQAVLLRPARSSGEDAATILLRSVK
jgi:hypothetical protein